MGAFFVAENQNQVTLMPPRLNSVGLIKVFRVIQFVYTRIRQTARHQVLVLTLVVRLNHPRPILTSLRIGSWIRQNRVPISKAR